MSNHTPTSTYIFGVFLILTLCGCAGILGYLTAGWLGVVTDSAEIVVTDTPSTTIPTPHKFDNIVRIIDEEAGVVLWLYYSNTRSTGGITALPIDQTSLAPD